MSRSSFLQVWVPALLVVVLAGCSSDDTDSPADTSENSTKVSRSDGNSEGGSQRSGSRSRTARRPGSYSVPRVTDTPEPEPLPLVISLKDFTQKDNGQELEGGWALFANGVIEASPVHVETTMTKAYMEARGTIAKGEWPAVVVQLDPLSSGTSTRIFPQDNITSSTFSEYVRTIDPPLPPGEYRLTFRFTNNEDFADTNEDRSVVLKRISLMQR